MTMEQYFVVIADKYNVTEIWSNGNIHSNESLTYTYLELVLTSNTE
jgi:hypothetical protein